MKNRFCDNAGVLVHWCLIDSMCELFLVIQEYIEEVTVAAIVLVYLVIYYIVIENFICKTI